MPRKRLEQLAERIQYKYHTATQRRPLAATTALMSERSTLHSMDSGILASVDSLATYR